MSKTILTLRSLGLEIKVQRLREGGILTQRGAQRWPWECHEGLVAMQWP